MHSVTKMINRSEVLYVACRLAAADMTHEDSEVDMFDKIVDRSTMYAEAAVSIIVAANEAAEAANEMLATG